MMDWNVDPDIRKNQRTQCFQEIAENVVLLLSFLRLPLPVTHNIDLSCNFFQSNGLLAAPKRNWHVTFIWNRYGI